MKPFIKSIFDNHPTEDVVYSTTSGYGFFKVTHALSHSLSLEDNTVMVTHRDGTSYEYDPASEGKAAPHAAFDTELNAEAEEKAAQAAIEKAAEAKQKAADDAEKEAREKEAREKEANEEPAQEEPAQEEPAQEEPAQEEPAQEEPAQEEPAKKAPAKPKSKSPKSKK